MLDKDLLTHALTLHRLPERLAAFLPEDSISETNAVIGELVGLHPSLWTREHQIAEAVLQLAHVGRVIFVGRAAHLITRAVPGGLQEHDGIRQPDVRAHRLHFLHRVADGARSARVSRSSWARLGISGMTETIYTQKEYIVSVS